MLPPWIDAIVLRALSKRHANGPAAKPQTTPRNPGRTFVDSSGQLHAVPLRAKFVGEVSFEVHVPWKPNCTFPPGAMVEL